MIRKLRRRFIVSSMLALVLVLGVIMGTINLINYVNVVRSADAVLDLLVANGGSFPGLLLDHGERGPERPWEEDADDEDVDDPNAEDDVDEDDLKSRLFQNGGRHGGRLDSPELPFETRYFTVTLDASGAVSGTELGRIAAVDADTAAQMAARTGRRARGFVGEYRFVRETLDDGERLLFVDCGQNLAFFRSFLATSGLISLLGLAAVFGLIVLFSGQITRPAAESYEKQRRFITDAGHELKTPLTIINADADVLAMDVGEDNEWLQDIQRQTGRLAELTGDLVQLARMEETDAASFAVFSLSEAVAEIAQSFQGPALNEGKRFDLDIAPGLNLRGDVKAVKRLTSILLDNAVKYSDAGGAIRLTLIRQGKSAALTVYNTCEHIDRADLPHLFERFYRTEKSRNSEKGGSGIGLSIAEAVVLAHKGRINAVTDDERSLRITAELPLIL